MNNLLGYIKGIRYDEESSERIYEVRTTLEPRVGQTKKEHFNVIAHVTEEFFHDDTYIGESIGVDFGDRMDVYVGYHPYAFAEAKCELSADPIDGKVPVIINKTNLYGVRDDELEKKPYHEESFQRRLKEERICMEEIHGIHYFPISNVVPAYKQGDSVVVANYNKKVKFLGSGEYVNGFVGRVKHVHPVEQISSSEGWYAYDVDVSLPKSLAGHDVSCAEVVHMQNMSASNLRLGTRRKKATFEITEEPPPNDPNDERSDKVFNEKVTCLISKLSDEQKQLIHDLNFSRRNAHEPTTQQLQTFYDTVAFPR